MKFKIKDNNNYNKVLGTEKKNKQENAINQNIKEDKQTYAPEVYLEHPS